MPSASAAAVTEGDAAAKADSAPNKSSSKAAVKQLRRYLKTNRKTEIDIASQDFASVPLTKQDVTVVRKLLAADQLERVRGTRQEEMKARVLTNGDLKMPFDYKQFGKKPAKGWSLYISMHGGGGAPAAVNDQQWENQKRLYELEEGIYVAPRAPTDTWNLWHQGHIDPLFIRLIENMVAFEGVNRNRVYIMGYSAGGDGVYQLAPRMADHWAGAAMMAGHPNETSPLGLRNLPFILQMGGRDSAYQRNEIAGQWKKKLADLQANDAGGYTHEVKIYADKGHWMDREDAIAIPWLAKHTRNPTPERIVWKQDDVTHSQFYWLGVDKENEVGGSEITAEVDGQAVSIQSPQVRRATIYLDDRFIDLDRPVVIRTGEDVLFEGHVSRTIATMYKTFAASHDPALSFPAGVAVDLVQNASGAAR